MKSRIVQIGNSRGIRLPKVLLEEAQLYDEVELQAEPGRIVIRQGKRPRTETGSDITINTVLTLIPDFC